MSNRGLDHGSSISEGNFVRSLDSRKDVFVMISDGRNKSKMACQVA